MHYFNFIMQRKHIFGTSYNTVNKENKLSTP